MKRCTESLNKIISLKLSLIFKKGEIIEKERKKSGKIPIEIDLLRHSNSSSNRSKRRRGRTLSIFCYFNILIFLRDTEKTF